MSKAEKQVAAPVAAQADKALVVKANADAPIETVDVVEAPKVESIEAAPEVKPEDQFAKGADAEMTRLEGCISAAKGDVAFGLECYRKGMDANAAKLAYADKAIAAAEQMAQELNQYKAKSGGAEPVAVAVSNVKAFAADDNSPEAIKAEWEANRGDCRNRFSSEQNFSAFRRYVK